MSLCYTSVMGDDSLEDYRIVANAGSWADRVTAGFTVGSVPSDAIICGLGGHRRIEHA